MYWNVNGGPYQDTIVSNISTDLWTCTIPAYNALDTICYYFQALDWNNVEGYFPPFPTTYVSPIDPFHGLGAVNCFIVGVGVGIDETASTNHLASAYPNPADNTVWIELLMNGIAEAKLFDATGRLVLHKSLPASTSIDIQSLPSGFYTLQVIQKETVHVSRLFIAR
jgi:hypothetical protein